MNGRNEKQEQEKSKQKKLQIPDEESSENELSFQDRCKIRNDNVKTITKVANTNIFSSTSLAKKKEVIKK